MQLRALLIVSALLASLPMIAACSSAGGGSSEQALYYPPPVNYNPSAGLLPALSEPFSTSVPSSPPFKP